MEGGMEEAETKGRECAPNKVIVPNRLHISPLPPEKI
jgi:hypothetical protein